MNSLFKKLSLPAKLALIGFIPVALLLFFASQIHVEKTERLQILDGVKRQVSKSSAISKLINDIQIERRASFTFALQNIEASALHMARAKTDSSISALETGNNIEIEKFSSYSLLDSLKNKRNQIDRKQIRPSQITEYYTNLIVRLNSLASLNLEDLDFLMGINRDLTDQRLLTEMATQLGLLRAHIYYEMYRKSESERDLANLKNTYQIYQSYYKEFTLKSDTTLVQQFLIYKNTGKLQKTLDFLDRIFYTNEFDYSYDPEEWRFLSAAAVDEINRLQEQTLAKANNRMDILYKQEQSDKDRNILFLILMVTFVIVIVFYTIQHISQALDDLGKAAKTISTGSTGIELDMRSKDSIGSLAKSIQEIDRSNIEITKAAKAIGDGDFSINIKPRSESDILGNAIIQMKNDLQEYTSNHNAKLWIQSGINAVSEGIRGDKEIEVVGTDSLNALVTYLQAEVGFFYNSNYKQLEYVSGYAVHDTAGVPKTLHFGETLIGQAAVNKKTIILNSVPNDFARIRSASGMIEPQHILILPLIHNELVEGVIEIGSMKPFHEKTPDFIQEVSADIAIALSSAKSRSRLKELLEETQAQAEELQAQHSEMEHLNTELEAQTHRLQASEEELKVQQEELLQTNQELEERSRLLEEKNQMIVERNYEIQKKAEELAISTRYKSEFLANMSHELRTPLNSILLLSRLLYENNEHNLTDDQIEYARVIQYSGNGLLSLIDEILDLSKIEAGKMELELVPFKLEEILENMRSLFLPLAKQKNLDFNITINPGTPHTIESDKMRLEQIIKNLLSNSFKFTSEGSVNLVLGSAGNDQRFIEISVQDTGIGIPHDKQKLVFEAFQQADGSTRRKYGGTGLGLSISRELAKLLGGEIRLNSEPGAGSTFTVLIPVKRQMEKKEIPEPVKITDDNKMKPAISTEQPVQRRFTSAKIPENISDDRENIAENDRVLLIVEDDTPFAKALLDYTRNKGYKGVVAVRGDQAIELAEAFKPVGILLDIQLPVKDGWEVMEELKSNPDTRHIPVHIMSSMEVKKESLDKGAIDFINKPVAFEKMNEIFEKIEKVLNREHKQVLIVEENSKHAKALAYFLETYHVSSQISRSIEDGVNALTNQEVDCVIIDMGIPDKKAYETLESVKKTPGLEHLPIIIFTGKNISQGEEQRIRQYANSIVIKTAHSYQRILDEVSLFLHLVEENGRPSEINNRFKQLGSLNEVLYNKKILIADDDIRNIFSVTKTLEKHRMNVISAMDGNEALKLLEENPDVDIVLMDIMMPVMDGYEAIQRIRQHKLFKKLPVIALTAKAMTGDREKCIEAGASDYISKPVDTDQLLSLLRVWLYDKSMF